MEQSQFLREEDSSYSRMSSSRSSHWLDYSVWFYGSIEETVNCSQFTFMTVRLDFRFGKQFDWLVSIPLRPFLVLLSLYTTYHQICSKFPFQRENASSAQVCFTQTQFKILCILFILLARILLVCCNLVFHYFGHIIPFNKNHCEIGTSWTTTDYFIYFYAENKSEFKCHIYRNLLQQNVGFYLWSETNPDYAPGESTVL